MPGEPFATPPGDERPPGRHRDRGIAPGDAGTVPGCQSSAGSCPYRHAADARLDGKFLLRPSDPTLSAADVATGYKQLLEVERGWRDMKTTLELRPVHHRKEQRIRAHVLLCWLSLLLIRLAENATGETWRTLRAETDKLHLGRFDGSAGEVAQRTELTARQAAIFKALGAPEPPRIFGLAPAKAAVTA